MKQCRRALVRLQADYRVKIALGTGELGYVEPHEPPPPPAIRFTLAIRAELIRVGGADPGARFKAHGEDSAFTLSVNREQAKELGQHLYGLWDINALVRRREDGAIGDGELLEYTLVTPGDVLSKLRDAFRGGVDEDWERAADGAHD